MKLSATGNRICRLILPLAAAIALGGCSQLGVKPYQRDILASADMALDAEAAFDAMDDHVFFSKEATSGGRSFAGGGCGCN